MTLREKIAQMIFPDYRSGRTDPAGFNRLIDEGIGGLCLFGGRAAEVPGLIRAMQERAKIPLLVAADYEDGAGSQVDGATKLPTNMAVGATGSEELAELKGFVTARQAVAFGVRWIFAPVVDVNSNPLNPIVNTRSFGQDPAQVGRLARAYTRGVTRGGALSCAKHFPGHGDVDVDSHLDLPRVTAARSRLDAVELAPFRVAQADSVMTAHLRVEAIDPERPASLSAKATEVLVRDLGFQGLIVTDALMMGGITKVCPEPEALESAARAGAHVLLIPQDPMGAIGHLEAAVKAGRVPLPVIDAAVARISGMKGRTAALPSDALDTEAAADRIAEASITKVADAGLLPLRGPVRFAAMKDDGARGDLAVFEKSLTVSDSADVGVLAVFSSIRAFSGRNRTSGDALEEARRKLGGVKKLVVVSFGNPYLQVPGADAYVCAYGDCRASQAAAARALKGEIPFRGTLPVSLTPLRPL